MERISGAKLVNRTQAVDVLCALIANLGQVEPEFNLVSSCIAKTVSADKSAMKELIQLVGAREPGAIQCASQILPSLKGKAQVHLAGPLVEELLRKDVIDNVTDSLGTSLRQINNPKAKRAIIKKFARSLESSDSLKIRHSVGFLSYVGDRSVETGMVKVLRKLLKGYYQDQAQSIRKDLCQYFAKVKSTKAVPALLTGMVRFFDICFSEALGATCDSYPRVQDDVLKVFKKADGNIYKDAIKLSCLQALSAMQKTRPSVTKLANLVNSDDLRYDSFRAEFKRILLRNPKESKPILLTMIREENERQCQFSLELLKEMHIPLAEVAKSVGSNPSVALYEFFFGNRPHGLGFSALWEAKERLGDNVKGKTTRFEHLVRHLLSCLGFVTLDVDPSGRPGVDTVALSPTWSFVLLVGQTTGPLANDLEKLANTTRAVRNALGQVARKIGLLPVVATSLTGETHRNDEQYAREHGIVILRQSDINLMIEWVSTNKDYKKLLAYLETKTRKRYSSKRPGD